MPHRISRALVARRIVALPLLALPLLALILLALALAGGASRCTADDEPVRKPLPEGGVRLGDGSTQRWQVGIVLTAEGGDCVGAFGTATVPTNWPEQAAAEVKRDLSPEVKKLEFRTLDNGVRQMIVHMPKIAAGATAYALVTFEVTRHALLPPEDPSVFRLPKITRELRPFLTDSPLIESNHNQIENLAEEILKPVRSENAWKQVETIYDWVRDHVEYKNGPGKGALAALREGDGDCEELTGLFIALCRASKIPARMVWIPDHCYPEFYLEDAKGQGHWIPCQAAGSRDFGSMPEFRPVLQKGDNFRVPEQRKPQRYVAEFLKVKAVKGQGNPRPEFIRKLLPAGE